MDRTLIHRLKGKGSRESRSMSEIENHPKLGQRLREEQTKPLQKDERHIKHHWKEGERVGTKIPPHLRTDRLGIEEDRPIAGCSRQLEVRRRERKL